MNVSLLHKMIAEGYVVKKRHATVDLHLYNYTPLTQYEQVWNEVTLACRGLILDGEHNVIARPFPKFFNLGEREEAQIPNTSFEVFEKMDGSLGILYWIDGQPAIATRGSFESRQAIKATELLHAKYQHAITKLDQSKTYLFEIIYPENRIVLDYGSEEILCLIGILDRETGEDCELAHIGFPVVKKYDGITDIHLLKATEESQREGYVIKYKNGFRLKVKFEEYLRIHKMVTEFSSIRLWQMLSAGLSIAEILVDVPDEFYQWVKLKEAALRKEYEAIEQTCLAEYKVFDTRKSAAQYILGCAHPSVLFAMLDQKEYAGIIWKMLRPVFERPFANK